MDGKRSTILYLHQRAPDAALEALNRLTGLRFRQWPESLVVRDDAPTRRAARRSGKQAVGAEKGQRLNQAWTAFISAATGSTG